MILSFEWIYYLSFYGTGIFWISVLVPKPITVTVVLYTVPYYGTVDQGTGMVWSDPIDFYRYRNPERSTVYRYRYGGTGTRFN